MLGVIFSFVPVMGALETGMECGLWRDPEELTVKGPALAMGIPGSSCALHLLMTSTCTFCSAELAPQIHKDGHNQCDKWRRSR